MTAPVADVDSDVLMDFEPPCSIKTQFPTGQIKVCENPAKWSGRTPCCGLVGLVCEHHRFDHGPFRCHCGKHTLDLIGWARL